MCREQWTLHKIPLTHNIAKASFLHIWKDLFKGEMCTTGIRITKINMSMYTLNTNNVSNRASSSSIKKAAYEVSVTHLWWRPRSLQLSVSIMVTCTSEAWSTESNTRTEIQAICDATLDNPNQKQLSKHTQLHQSKC